MRLEVILPTVDIVRWGFSDFLFQYVRYIHAVIVFQGFYSSLRSEVLCIISVGYTQCDFYHIFSPAMICLPFKNFVHAYMIPAVHCLQEIIPHLRPRAISFKPIFLAHRDSVSHT